MPSSVPIPPRSRPAVAALLGLIASAAAFSVFVIGQSNWIDDAWISFRYAHNFVNGHGLVFNVGDAVEGYTNFLWTLTAALGIALRFDPIYFAQGASILAQAVTLWAVYEIGRAAGQRGWRLLIAPLFLAGSVAFLSYPMSGMESSFFTMLVTLAFLLLQREVHRTRAGGLGLGLALLALPLARFDGFVPVLLLISYPILFRAPRRETWRRLLLPLVVFGVGLAAYNLWRISFYPTAMPNTVLAKTSVSLLRARAGLTHVSEFAVGHALILLTLGAAPFLLMRASHSARFLGWVVLGQMGYVVVVGGDWMPHYRFLLTVLPLLAALMQEGASTIADRMPLPKPVWALVLLGLFAFHSGPARAEIGVTQEDGKFFRPHDAKRIGQFLDGHLSEDEWFAIEWGGIVPFYAPRRRALDTWGLTDRAIPQHKDLAKMKWGTHTNPAYLASRAPDLIAPCARLMPTEEQARESYTPGGANYYGYYPHMLTPEFGYELRIFKIAEGAWWPALVRSDR